MGRLNNHDWKDEESKINVAVGNVYSELNSFKEGIRKLRVDASPVLTRYAYYTYARSTHFHRDKHGKVVLEQTSGWVKNQPEPLPGKAPVIPIYFRGPSVLKMLGTKNCLRHHVVVNSRTTRLENLNLAAKPRFPTELFVSMVWAINRSLIYPQETLLIFKVCQKNKRMTVCPKIVPLKLKESPVLFPSETMAVFQVP